jgi:hypothetical protein
MVAKRNDNMLGRLALQVAIGRTVAAAARDLEVDPKTAQHWARQPDFKNLVTRHRDSIINRTVGKLVRYSTKAIETMGKLLDSPNESVRLSAARCLMDKLIEVETHAAQSRQLSAMQEQLAALAAATPPPAIDLESNEVLESPVALEPPADSEATDGTPSSDEVK